MNGTPGRALAVLAITVSLVSLINHVGTTAASCLGEFHRCGTGGNAQYQVKVLAADGRSATAAFDLYLPERGSSLQDSDTLVPLATDSEGRLCFEVAETEGVGLLLRDARPAGASVDPRMARSD